MGKVIRRIRSWWWRQTGRCFLCGVKRHPLPFQPAYKGPRMCRFHEKSYMHGVNYGMSLKTFERYHANGK